MTTENPPSTLPATTKPKHTGVNLGNTRSLVPANYTEAKAMAIELAKSEIIPKEFIGRPANVLVAIMFGTELGLPPAQALQNIMVVNGRPALWGDAVGAKVKSSDVWEAERDEFDEAKMTATFQVKRVGQDWISRSFSKADAEKAGLWDKQGPWKQYPKRMLFNRARAFAYRDCFPDVLKGLRIVEEERDIIDTTAERVEPDMPRRASAPAPQPPSQPAPSESAASQDSNEPKKVSVKFEKVQKLSGEARWRAIGKDGVDYMTGVEEYATAAQKAIKADVAADVEYEDGIGCREIFTLVVNLPA